MRRDNESFTSFRFIITVNKSFESIKIRLFYCNKDQFRFTLDKKDINSTEKQNWDYKLNLEVEVMLRYADFIQR